MKKLILIPTALITSLTPVISLVGCNKWHIPPAPEGAEEITTWIIKYQFQDSIILRAPTGATTKKPVKYRAIINLKQLEYQNYFYGNVVAMSGGATSAPIPATASGIYTNSCSFKEKTSPIGDSDTNCYFNSEMGWISFARQTRADESIVIDFAVNEEDASRIGEIDVELYKII